MNYRHIYHAGNFADLLKHLVLISIIEKMKEKPTPFTVLDAFAGIGIYDLDSPEASKTLEHENGVSLFLEKISEKKDIPDVCMKYNEIIDKLNNMPGLHLYPGSPYIISETIREDDSFIACELHKGDYLMLRENIRQNIHNMDAYNAIKAFLPPKNNRGLVFLTLLLK
ncbi:MAG UNVERIFIED_CONTAM: 23S rRNA (adenine(2030)-N(6))-methyltransferase RlmJ [Rickettsiaceae bacterium]|jgi:23S rRNA (adenine2030-N6)-methyltransferase